MASNHQRFGNIRRQFAADDQVRGHYIARGGRFLPHLRGQRWLELESQYQVGEYLVNSRGVFCLEIISEAKVQHLYVRRRK